MRRREFITLLGGAAAWPLAARAEQAERMRRIGVLVSSAEDDVDMQARVAGFRQGLEKLGWLEDRNARIDVRFAAGKADHFEVLAKELIALQPDVIFGHSSPLVAALQRENRKIPIVFVSVSDPIGSGFVASLARPAGNLTGLLQYEEGIAGKWLGMLKEIAPGLTRASFMANPKTTVYDYFLRAARSAAPSLMIEIVPNPVETPADIERAIESTAREQNGGLVLPPDTTTILYRDLIITLAARHQLPAVYPFRVFVTAGGLMSYGTEQVAMFQQAARYVDRILRGANPAELPVQAPTKFETVVNLNAAKTIGLTVPAGLLLAADEVIE